MDTTTNTTPAVDDPDAGIPEHLRFPTQDEIADRSLPDLPGMEPGAYAPFTILTIATDGCGNYLVLDGEGRELERVAAERVAADEDEEKALAAVLGMVRRAWLQMGYEG